MKDFFIRHILFPKQFGYTPYYWLVFLLPTLIQIFTTPSWLMLCLYLVLLIIFLKNYRDAYVVSKTLTKQIIIQLIIALFFGITLNNGYLFIFTAWEIGSLPLPKQRFKTYLCYYGISCFISLGTALFTHPINLPSELYSIIFVAICAIISPNAARSLASSYRKTEQLTHTNQRLERVIKQQERDRIARDLHDNLGQTFSIITLKAELAEKLLVNKPELVKSELEDIAKTSRDSLNSVRQIIANLQEKTLPKTMLEETANLHHANIMVTSQNEEHLIHWPAKIQHSLSLIIKEAVTNVIRHSQATQVTIAFNEDSNDYYLTIDDNGLGFDTVRKGSQGLVGMTYRVEELGGTIQINSRHGTNIHVTLPKENQK